MKLSAPIYHLKRQAKQLSRGTAQPLSAALNTVAAKEGYQSWSQLAAHHTTQTPSMKIFATLTPGDMVLIGARPGHGKTRLGLDLVAHTLKTNTRAAFYSLEYTDSEVVNQLETRGVHTKINPNLTYDTSDDICADYIIGQLPKAPCNTVVVIDYLQLLDQNRAKPTLNAQVSALKSFAESAAIIVILISQIFDGPILLIRQCLPNWFFCTTVPYISAQRPDLKPKNGPFPNGPFVSQM